MSQPTRKLYTRCSLCLRAIVYDGQWRHVTADPDGIEHSAVEPLYVLPDYSPRGTRG